MTRTQVVLIALLGALLGTAPGLWWPLWTVAVAQVVIASASAWATFTMHARVSQERAELQAVGRATVAARSLLIWEVRLHDDDRWSLEWARGRPLLAWRTQPHYRPTPEEEGPYTYWLDTWEDSSGHRDECIRAALATGEAQRWIAGTRGRIYETEATAMGPRSVLCVTHDVTGIERHGAQRGRKEVVAAARRLESMQGVTDAPA